MHSSLVEYLAQVIFGKKKTIPTIFFAFSIWNGYLCPPHKILGVVYESSSEHVFHKVRFLSISFIFKGGTFMKKKFFGRFILDF